MTLFPPRRTVASVNLHGGRNRVPPEEGSTVTVPCWSCEAGSGGTLPMLFLPDRGLPPHDENFLEHLDTTPLLPPQVFRLSPQGTVRPYSQTHSQTHTHTDTHTGTHKGALRDTLTQAHTDTPTHTQTHSETHTSTHSQTHSHTLRDILRDTLTHRHTHTDTHRHTFIQAHSQTHTPSQAQVYTGTLQLPALWHTRFLGPAQPRFSDHNFV